jgi:hypothetical protein
MQGRSFVAARAVVAAGSVALVVLGLSAVSAGAGTGPVSAAPLTIVKTLTGSAPTGTTFTATLECDDNVITGGSDTATVSFDSTGQPTTPDVITFTDSTTCTVTETATGGAAATTYACESTVPPADESLSVQQVEPEPICPSAGPQAGPITVNIEFEDQTATVTIHNTFPASPTPQVAQEVVAQPTFTG